VQRPPHEREPDDEFVRRMLPAFHVQASPDFQRNVLARIDALAASRRRRPRRGMPAWVPWVTPALAAAAVVVLSTLTFWVNGPLAPEWARHPVATDASGLRGGASGPKQGATFDALIREGIRQRDAGHASQAMQAFQEAINRIAYPLNELAVLTYTASPQHDNAVKGLPWAQLAVQLRPDDADYLETFAVLLCAAGDHDKAIQTMEKAARLQSQASKQQEDFAQKLARLRQGVCP